MYRCPEEELIEELPSWVSQRKQQLSRNQHLQHEYTDYQCVWRFGERDEASVRLERGVVVSERAGRERQLGESRRALHGGESLDEQKSLSARY